ncbi:hypothetical protein GWI33_008987 [Rhynchophorus ferrugineus]|uniref:ABC transporter domain-containing protein n=1 Tax=Rhynchophorus ferrugineus TaxID=354439 RepID=A0A834MAP4_RHYFE|nr:hypothetical protein GWI33_008987 [Rhynchophorus ferrugineus]
MYHKLRVILWKNCIIRKRHWFLTLCESVIPVLFFVLLAYARSKIDYLGRVDIGVTNNYKEPIDYIPVGLNLGETQIYYAPKTPFNWDIIHSVQEKFSIINNNVKGFSDKESLLEYFKATGNNETLVAVIFNSKNSTRKLDYTLSYHQQGLNWETENLYNNPYSFEPGTGTPYHFRGYLQLQLAIDMSYIEKISKKDTENIFIQIQEFPYPPHKADKGLTPMFYHFLPLVTLMSFIFVCPSIIQRVVAEKHSGIKELVKMVGMRSWMLWLSWFIYSIAPMVVSVLIITFCLKISTSDLPVIQHTSGTIIFTFLMLYVLAACISALFLSTLFSKPTMAMLVGLIYWILSYFVPIYSLDPNNNGISKLYDLLMMLLPNTSLYFGYSIIALFEEREIGVNWRNIFTPPDDATGTVTMANVFAMLLFDCVIYMILTFYFDAVNPGKFGIKQSWFYPISYPINYLIRFCKKDSKTECPESTHLEVIEKGELNIGIQLENVSKEFNKKFVVRNLSLDIYKDQITVLLGHNGAGKSTTIGMITGLIRKTWGKISINGKESNSRSALSNSIGLCTQHNLFFPDLTVEEHLKFFAKLKGKFDADEITKLLKKLSLEDKANSMPHTLSGGMKRKLCLGMAVVGNSKILVLDEPSSGMDPESRRELWDLLLNLRRNRTILITTHFLDEADALADWIAIMEDGHLRCFGTPMGLKKQYDIGYYLKLLINEKADVMKAVEELKNEIRINVSKNLYDNITFCRPDGNEIVLMLPTKNNYTKLFECLERGKEDLKIDCMSFTSTTLEDVFLGLKPKNTDNDQNDIDSLKLDIKKEQHYTFINPAIALFSKRFKFTYNKLLEYIIPAILAFAMLLLCVLLSGMSFDSLVKKMYPLKIDLDSYGKTTVYFNHTLETGVIKLANLYDKLVQSRGSFSFNSEDVSDDIVRQGLQNIQYYRRHMVASAEFVQSGNELQITGLYNALAKHSAPISLNLITNTLSKSLLGEDYSITLSNLPLKDDNNYVKTFSDIQIGVLWLLIIPIGLMFFVGTFIYFPYFELSSNFLQLQFMCGISSRFYWVCLFISDYMLYILFVVIITCISMLWDPFYGPKEFGFLCAILCLYGFSSIPYAYLFSRNKSLASSYSAFIISGIICGIIPCLIVKGMQESQNNSYMSWGNYLMYLFYIINPPFIFTYLGVNFSNKVMEKYQYLNMKFGEKIAYCNTNKNHPCCAKDQSCSGIYYDLLDSQTCLLVVLGAFIFLLISIILESNMVKRCHNYCRKQFKHRNKTNSHVERRTSSTNQPLLNVKCLEKYFSNNLASHVNFALDKGQCMGLLGVNGAGKSTAFRMLTGEEIKDGGTISMRHVNSNQKIDILDETKYLPFIGYCPQNDSLNIFLTGRQILDTMAQLRGLKNTKEIVNNVLDVFELTDIADLPCQRYSGGNKRKLSFAVSILGLPSIILLDEPTNGVDAHTRRKFWRLIKKLKEEKQIAFLLTSHSMPECEAVCNNIKIMKSGKIEKDGTIVQLKNEHGVTVKLKLNTKHSLESSDEVDSNSKNITIDNMESLKKYLSDNYEGTVKDEHPGYLHYYIKKCNKRWSELFREFHRLQESSNQYIEDYLLTDASLEDVFIDVAKKL